MYIARESQRKRQTLENDKTFLIRSEVSVHSRAWCLTPTIPSRYQNLGASQFADFVATAATAKDTRFEGNLQILTRSVSAGSGAWFHHFRHAPRTSSLSSSSSSCVELSSESLPGRACGVCDNNSSPWKHNPLVQEQSIYRNHPGRIRT